MPRIRLGLKIETWGTQILGSAALLSDQILAILRLRQWASNATSSTLRQFLSRLRCPCCTQGVQDEAVFEAQVGWIRDDLVRIVNACVLRNTPRLVTNYSITVRTSRSRAESVAVDQRRSISSLHWQLLPSVADMPMPRSPAGPGSVHAI